MKKIILLLSVLGLAACSSGGGGNGGLPGSDLPELTPDQKTRVVTVSSELNDINDAASSQGGAKPAAINNDNFQPLSRATATAKNSGLSEKATQLKGKMDSAINLGQCAVTTKPGINNTTDSGNSNLDPINSMSFEDTDMSNLDFEILITHSDSSNQCPIYFLSSFSNVMDMQDGSPNSSNEMKMKMKFEVSESSEIYDDLDISAFNFEMASKVSTTMQNETAAKIDITASGAGTLTSKTEGNVGMTVAMTGGGIVKGDPSTGESNSAINMSFTVSINFPDFKVVGHMKSVGDLSGGDTGMNAEYFINGKSVTEEQFNEIFQGDFLANSSSNEGTVSVEER